MVNLLIYIYVSLWPLFNQYILVDMGAGIPDITVQILLLPLLAVIVFLSVGKPQLGKIFVWMMLYFVYILAGLVIHSTPYGVVSVIQELIQVYFLPFLIYFVIYNYREKLDFTKLAFAVMLGGMVIAGVGLAEFMAGQNLIGKLDFDPTRARVLYRTNGPFHDSIGYASLLLLYVSFSYYSLHKSLTPKIYAMFSMAVVSLGSFVNFSRAAIGALLVILSVFYARNMKVVISLVVVAVISIPVLLFMTDVVDLLVSSDAYKQRTSSATVMGRWQLFTMVFKLIASDPLVGIGYDNFAFQHGGVTHNSFLQVAVELGLIGLVLFVGFISVLTVGGLWHARRLGDSISVRTRVGIIFITFFVSNTITLLHSPHYMTALMIIMACLNATIDTKRAVIGAGNQKASKTVLGIGKKDILRVRKNA